MEARGREAGRKRPLDPLLLALRLLPFLTSCALYFLLWLPEEEPSWMGALAKCLPILCLAGGVHVAAPPGPYSRGLCRGLLCSALGDVLLVWPDCFVFGMAAFALAHVFYVQALGWVPIRLALLGPGLVVSGLYFRLLKPHLPAELGLPVGLYIAILALMQWRALARGSPAALGGVLFSVSDAVLGWDTFVRPLASGRLTVMVTYYAAQGLLALSAEQGRPRRAD
ncbi:lysoplasmalogenase [Monodelphis domestica]|uniref:lysoplasmalogenase n=1 Tax=Monodelphis domestica TaxID=13616 RepID=UPI0024E244F9|nr:lysoplasmalogenase [Monodelphis domestica]